MAPPGGVNKNLLAPPKNYYVDDAALFQYSIAAGHAIIFRYSESRQAASQPDDGVQAHLVHEEGGGEVSKHRWLLGPAGIPCGEMLGPDKCSGDDKGQVVIATP